MNIESAKRKYARVLVEIGTGLKVGQALCVEAPTEAADFVALIAEAAYDMDCGEFGVIWQSKALQRAVLKGEGAHVNEADRLTAEYFASKRAGFIRLDTVDLDAFADFDAETMSKKSAADGVVRKLFNSIVPPAGRTIACFPTQSWADLVFPELPENERLDALWEAVLKCVYCDEEDPIAIWRQYIKNTGARKAALDKKGYSAFHYTASGTDLTLYPIPGHNWMGGYIPIPGRPFSPNIPTQEIFTSPAAGRSEGYVSATLPLNWGGHIIEGIKLRFEAGKVVEYSAVKGEEFLKAILDSDDRAPYLGEMALVDQRSPISQLGRLFYTTLYDENASCHIALGNAYGPADPEVRKAKDYNTSPTHVDLMIGAEDMNIRGLTKDGVWEDVFVDGSWAEGLFD